MDIRKVKPPSKRKMEEELEQIQAGIKLKEEEYVSFFTRVCQSRVGHCPNKKILLKTRLHCRNRQSRPMCCCRITEINILF